MTKEELIRQIRKMITAEYGAIADYTTLAEQCEDELARKVLISIANEERVHAGEFLSLLFTLCPDEETFYTGGEEEVQKLKDKLENSSLPINKESVEEKKSRLLDKLLKEPKNEDI